MSTNASVSGTSSDASSSLSPPPLLSLLCRQFVFQQLAPPTEDTQSGNSPNQSGNDQRDNVQTNDVDLEAATQALNQLMLSKLDIDRV